MAAADVGGGAGMRAAVMFGIISDPPTWGRPCAGAMAPPTDKGGSARRQMRGVYSCCARSEIMWVDRRVLVDRKARFRQLIDRQLIDRSTTHPDRLDMQARERTSEACMGFRSAYSQVRPRFTHCEHGNIPSHLWLNKEGEEKCGG